MNDTLNYVTEKHLLKGIKLLLSNGVRQLAIAFHQPSNMWVVSYPPQQEQIYDECAEAQPD